MKKFVATSIVATAILVVGASQAQAGTTTDTVHIANLPFSNPVDFVCFDNGPVFGSTTGTYTGVLHTTTLDNGTTHTTGTLIGPVTLALNGTAYVGRFTVWFGANANLNNGTSVFTFNANVATADGTTLSVHQAGRAITSASPIPHVVDVVTATCNFH